MFLVIKGYVKQWNNIYWFVYCMSFLHFFICYDVMLPETIFAIRMMIQHLLNLCALRHPKLSQFSTIYKINSCNTFQDKLQWFEHNALIRAFVDASKPMSILKRFLWQFTHLWSDMSLSSIWMQNNNYYCFPRSLHSHSIEKYAPIFSKDLLARICCVWNPDQQVANKRSIVL